MIDTADEEGGIHQDLEFILDTNPPANGVYLYGLGMTSSQYQTSDPVYMVMASGVDEIVHEAAVDWVVETFNVPEPNSVLLVVLLSVACLPTRRRKA